MTRFSDITNKDLFEATTAIRELLENDFHYPNLAAMIEELENRYKETL